MLCTLISIPESGRFAIGEVCLATLWYLCHYHCLHSPSLCDCPFGATHMSAATAPLYGPAVIAELSVTLVRLSGASNLMDACVGHLLAQWSGSSAHCKARWGQATVEGGHNFLPAVEDAAIREYPESLISPLGAVELVVALKAPKSGFCALSEFFTRQSLKYTLKTGRPFPRPICTRGAFNAEWKPPSS